MATNGIPAEGTHGYGKTGRDIARHYSKLTVEYARRIGEDALVMSRVGREFADVVEATVSEGLRVGASDREILDHLVWLWQGPDEAEDPKWPKEWTLPELPLRYALALALRMLRTERTQALRILETGRAVVQFRREERGHTQKKPAVLKPPVTLPFRHVTRLERKRAAGGANRAGIRVRSPPMTHLAPAGSRNPRPAPHRELLVA